MKQLGFGGGCHWCTEAVFESLVGVVDVRQGWIASDAPHDAFSEAVIVHFSEEITPDILIRIHLLTHSSTKRHSMRDKYRSAVYYFEESERDFVRDWIRDFSKADGVEYITQALPFREFKLNRDEQLHYYLQNKQAPFCETYINPKLSLLRKKFASHSKPNF